MLNLLKKVAMLVLCLAIMFSAQTTFAAVDFRNDQTRALYSNYGGPWGSLQPTVYCPPGSWAAGYSMRIEAWQKSGDDTALNAVKLYCRDRSGRQVDTISSHPGYWGQWVESVYCPQGTFFTQFRLKVESRQFSGDDTSANSIAFRCNNAGYYEGPGGSWGSYGLWRGGYANEAVCGIQVIVEAPQGPGDDTALNDVRLFWCRI